LVLLLILLAILGGGYWYLSSGRTTKEQEARDFAKEVAERVVLRGDTRILDTALSLEARRQYPPSWRDRMYERIREQGAPKSDMRVSGDVTFSHHFFEPLGRFKAEVDYVDGPAYLQLNVSQHGVLWQVDYLNWIWQPSTYRDTDAAAASPAPSPAPAATPHP
jgi:hypothetical protein